MKKQLLSFLAITMIIATSIQAQVITRYSQQWLKVIDSGSAINNAFPKFTESSNFCLNGGYNYRPNYISLSNKGSKVSLIGTQQNNSCDVYTTTLNANDGSLNWQYTFNNTGNDQGSNIGYDSTGNLFVTGIFNAGNSVSYFLSKFNSIGKNIFTNNLPNLSDNPQMNILGGKKILVKGIIYNSPITVTSFPTYAYDTSGNYLWQDTLKTNDYWYGYNGGFTIDKNQNIITTGLMQTNVYDPSTYAIVINKVNTSGKLLWSKVYRTPQNLPTFLNRSMICTDNTNNIYFLACSGSAPEYLRLVKVDGITGTVIKDSLLYNQGFPQAQIFLNTNGNIVVEYNDPSKGFQVFDGNNFKLLWTNNVATIYPNAFDNNGNLITTENNKVKIYSPLGNLLDTFQISLNNNTIALGQIIIDSINKSFYVSGNAYNTNSTKMFVAKYSIPTVLQKTSISSFTPVTASAGTTITIKGTIFTGSTSVTFGGTAATSFKVLNDSTITAVVGNGTSGNVVVVSPNGMASLGNFIFTPLIFTDSLDAYNNFIFSAQNATTQKWTIWKKNSNNIYAPIFNDAYCRRSVTVSVDLKEIVYAKYKPYKDYSVYYSPMSTSTMDSSWICKSNIDGSNEKILMLIPNFNRDGLYDMDWATNKKQLAFILANDAYPNMTRDGDVFLFDIDSSKLTNLTNDWDLMEQTVRFSKDNKSLFYEKCPNSWYGWPNDIYQKVLSSGTITQLTTATGYSQNDQVARLTGIDKDSSFIYRRCNNWNLFKKNGNNSELLLLSQTGLGGIYLDNGVYAETGSSDSSITFFKQNNILKTKYIPQIHKFIGDYHFDDESIIDLKWLGKLNGTLPIEIISIGATKNVDLSVFNWSTSNELNTSEFIIQHSSDGIFYTNIGNVNSIGFGANNYQFIDKNPINGINYYRLQIVNKDGSSSYSKVVSVNFGVNKSFSIIPNPARDFATISFSKSVDKATLAVYDITGKQVMIKSLSGSSSSYILNTQSLKSGLYVIKVNTATGNYNEKLLINK